MGDNCNRGRSLLLSVSVFMLAVPVYFLFVKAPGSGQAAEGVARLTVTAALVFFLLKGRNWARLTLAFFALTGAAYLDARLAFFREGLQDRELMELLVKAIGYTASGLLLVFSGKIKDTLGIRGGSSGEERTRGS